MRTSDRFIEVAREELSGDCICCECLECPGITYDGKKCPRERHPCALEENAAVIKREVAAAIEDTVRSLFAVYRGQGFAEVHYIGPGMVGTTTNTEAGSEANLDALVAFVKAKLFK